MADVIEITGEKEVAELFDKVLTTNPTMDKFLRKLIAQVMREARNSTSRDIRSYINDDPRKAYRAVKHSVYKSILGGNVSILSKRRASAVRATLNRHRKLDDNPTQRGGNRIKRVDDARNRLEQYYGSDRGFILRFINSGTVDRQSRYGNRGAIAGRNMFGHIAPWHLEKALEDLKAAALEYIEKQATRNG